MLEKHNIDARIPLTSLEWETIFAKMANAMDDLPIAKGNSSNVSNPDFELLTPNRLKLGRNNFRSPHIDSRIKDSSIPSDLLEKNRKIMSTFFQVLIDNLHHFQVKPAKWNTTSLRLPKIDDVIIFKYNESNSSIDWKVGRVVKVEPRKVSIMYSLKTDEKKVPTMKFVTRSYRDIVILLSEDEIYPNSREYFDNIIKD